MLHSASVGYSLLSHKLHFCKSIVCVLSNCITGIVPKGKTITKFILKSFRKMKQFSTIRREKVVTFYCNPAAPKCTIHHLQLKWSSNETASREKKWKTSAIQINLWPVLRTQKLFLVKVLTRNTTKNQTNRHIDSTNKGPSHMLWRLRNTVVSVHVSAPWSTLHSHWQADNINTLFYSDMIFPFVL